VIATILCVTFYILLHEMWGGESTLILFFSSRHPEPYFKENLPPLSFMNFFFWIGYGSTTIMSLKTMKDVPTPRLKNPSPFLLIICLLLSGRNENGNGRKQLLLRRL